MISLLIDFKSDLNLYDKNGETPLLIASNRLDFELVKFFIEKKAEINCTDNKKKNCLLNLVTNHKFKSSHYLCYLIENDSDVNLKDESGNNVLHHLSKLHTKINSKVMELLKQRISNFNEYNNENKRAIDLLSENKHFDFDFFKFLIENKCGIDLKGNTVKNMLSNSILHYNYDTLSFLFGSKVDINLALDDHNNSAIHLFCAAKKNSIKMLKFLIEKKSDLNLQNSNLRSPFHSFCEKREIPFETITYFVQNRAALNLKDIDGNTPLHCYSSIHRVPKTFKKIVSFLIYNGLDFHQLYSFQTVVKRLYVSRFPLDHLYQQYNQCSLWSIETNHLFPSYFQENVFSLLISLKLYSKTLSHIFPKPLMKVSIIFFILYFLIFHFFLQGDCQILFSFPTQNNKISN